MEIRFMGSFFCSATESLNPRGALRCVFKLLQVLVAVTFLGTSAQAGDHPLQVNNPTILLPAKSAQVVAGFAELVNHANSELRVTGISSEAFNRSEIHRTVVENDVAKMRKQDAIVVPAHSTVTLKHGGLHIMLMQPKKELSAGDKIVVNLELETGKTLPVSFEVSSDIATSTDHAGHGSDDEQSDKKNHNKHQNH